MSGGSSGPDSEPHGGAADLEATRTVAGGRLRADGAAEPTDGAAAETVTPRTATEVVRHGPGLTATAGQEPTVTTGPHQDGRTAGRAGRAPCPAAQPGQVRSRGSRRPAAASAGLTAEHIWRGGGTPGPRRRRSRLGQILGWALTVILLAASGVLFYLRFHHVPLQDTGVAIVGRGVPRAGLPLPARSRPTAAGNLTYQWLFPTGPPSTLHQSVSAGQSTVDVQARVIGGGYGTAPQRVWLRVLQPVRRTASEYILIRCP